MYVFASTISSTNSGYEMYYVNLCYIFEAGPTHSHKVVVAGLNRQFFQDLQQRSPITFIEKIAIYNTIY